MQFPIQSQFLRKHLQLAFSKASESILYRTEETTEPIIVPATPKTEVKTATKAEIQPTKTSFL